jgi:D-alanyl-D-alanine carboxypeptidase (penicillin-binding protein 5/6)
MASLWALALCSGLLVGTPAAVASPTGTALGPTGASTATASAGPTLAGTAPAPAANTVGGQGLAGTGVLMDVPAGVPRPPTMAAAAYLLADLTTGDVLVAKAPHSQHLPASTLKTLTALTVMPELDPASVVTAVPGDIADGSRVGIMPGLTYTVQQLLEGMMLSSGNDAATALARVAGGKDGVAGTVAAMQQEANWLGARDTVVHDPSGLDAPGQVTSVYDMALIAREALKNPAFRALVTTKRARFPGKPIPEPTTKPSGGRSTSTSASPTGSATPRRGTFEIQNHNTLLFNYDGAIGVKNGYTVAAKWTIIGAAERNGHRYVVTALTRSDRSWRPTAALLDWAFAHGAVATPIGHLVEPGQLQRAEATATPSAMGAVVGQHAQAAALTGTSPRRWVGAAGLAAAVLLVAAMGLYSRRPSTRGSNRRRSASGRGHRH